MLRSHSASRLLGAVLIFLVFQQQAHGLLSSRSIVQLPRCVLKPDGRAIHNPPFPRRKNSGTVQSYSRLQLKQLIEEDLPNILGINPIEAAIIFGALYFFYGPTVLYEFAREAGKFISTYTPVVKEVGTDIFNEFRDYFEEDAERDKLRKMGVDIENMPRRTTNVIERFQEGFKAFTESSSPEGASDSAILQSAYSNSGDTAVLDSVSEETATVAVTSAVIAADSAKKTKRKRKKKKEMLAERNIDIDKVVKATENVASKNELDIKESVDAMSDSLSKLQSRANEIGGGGGGGGAVAGATAGIGLLGGSSSALGADTSSGSGSNGGMQEGYSYLESPQSPQPEEGAADTASQFYQFPGSEAEEEDPMLQFAQYDFPAPNPPAATAIGAAGSQNEWGDDAVSNVNVMSGEEGNDVNGAESMTQDTAAATSASDRTSNNNNNNNNNVIAASKFQQQMSGEWNQRVLRRERYSPPGNDDGGGGDGDMIESEIEAGKYQSEIETSGSSNYKNNNNDYDDAMYAYSGEDEYDAPEFDFDMEKVRGVGVGKDTASSTTTNGALTPSDLAVSSSFDEISGGVNSGVPGLVDASANSYTTTTTQQSPQQQSQPQGMQAMQDEQVEQQEQQQQQEGENQDATAAMTRFQMQMSGNWNAQVMQQEVTNTGNSNSVGDNSNSLAAVGANDPTPMGIGFNSDIPEEISMIEDRSAVAATEPAPPGVSVSSPTEAFVEQQQQYMQQQMQTQMQTQVTASVAAAVAASAGGGESSVTSVNDNSMEVLKELDRDYMALRQKFLNILQQQEAQMQGQSQSQMQVEQSKQLSQQRQVSNLDQREA